VVLVEPQIYPLRCEVTENRPVERPDAEFCKEKAFPLPPATISEYPVIAFRRPTRALVLLLAAGAASAQTVVPVHPATPTPITIAKPTLPNRARAKPRIRSFQPPYNPNVIVLDAGHGGSDAGAKLGATGEEKDLNVAFADRLKTLLEAQQFTVVLTHASADEDPTPDQRAETANRARAVACLILHATNAGHGVHLFTSSLTAPFFSGGTVQDASITPWDSAQAPSLPRSLQLANDLSTSLNGLRVPLVVTRVSIRPIDSLTCAAVAVEIAPAAAESSVADETYQQQVAQALVTALGYWREQAQAQIAAAQAAAAPASSMAQPATPPPAKPKPRPIVAPDESPLAPDAAPQKAVPPKAAPIVRRPPPTSSNPPQGGQR
jgi:N-acetylmuramoyl-L-alanine amidase